LLEDFQFVKMAWELPDSTITHYMMDNTYIYITVAFKCPNITVNRIPYTPIDLIKLDLRRTDINGQDRNIPFEYELEGAYTYCSNDIIIDDAQY